mmetsp:Transcript_36296/g.104443  ORF Transcript_36296/g.104443 Transcript_36296/m.104443 type:complete len:203 (-) Transcript_36296:733-1341(-)
MAALDAVLWARTAVAPASPVLVCGRLPWTSRPMAGRVSSPPGTVAKEASRQSVPSPAGLGASSRTGSQSLRAAAAAAWPSSRRRPRHLSRCSRRRTPTGRRTPSRASPADLWPPQLRHPRRSCCNCLGIGLPHPCKTTHRSSARTAPCTQGSGRTRSSMEKGSWSLETELFTKDSSTAASNMALRSTRTPMERYSKASTCMM